jgi:hypothetical protein
MQAKSSFAVMADIRKRPRTRDERAMDRVAAGGDRHPESTKVVGCFAGCATLPARHGAPRLRRRAGRLVASSLC